MTSILNRAKQIKILVHAPNWLGDHVMAFPFYYALNEIFQNARIDLLGRNWVSSLLPYEVFSNVYSISGKMNVSEDFMKIKAEKYDIGISLSPSFRSIFLLKKAQTKYRVGYKTDFRSFLLKLPKPHGGRRIPSYNCYEHRALSYIRLLTPWFDNSKTAEDYFVSSTRQIIAKAALAKKSEKNNFLKRYNLKPFKYRVICPGSVALSKIYPIQYLIVIIEKIIEKNPKDTIVLAGTAIEKPYAKKIIESVEKKYKSQILDLTEKTSLVDLLFVLRNSKAAIANDSGVAHLTFLTETPLLTFLGMARKEETLMLNKKKIVLNKNLSCSPCMKQKCPKRKEYLKCLKSISPEEAFESLERLEKRYLT